MKIVKKLLIAFGVLLTLLVVAVVVGVAKIDSIAKAGIETGGTKALGTPTTLGSVSVGLFSGKVGMKNLAIGNPSGFKSPAFFTLGSGDVAVSLASLQKPVVEVPLLKFSEIRVALEKSSGKTNFGVILDNLKKVTGESTSKPKPAGGGGEKKFIVREIDIRDVKVHVDMLGVGGVADKLASVDIPIDQLRLTNVGTANGAGVDIETLASVIVKAVLQAASAKGQGLIPAELLGELEGQLAQLEAQLAQLDGLKNTGVEMIGKVGEQAQQLSGELAKKLGDVVPPDAAKQAADLIGQNVEGAAKQVEDATKGVQDAAKDAAKKAEDRLKGLIPGGKKKEEEKKPQ